MMKHVFVNATSATEGGTLIILNQFIEQIKLHNNNKIKYYIFTPIDISLTSDNYIEIVPVKAKKYIDRIKWDLYGLKAWSRSKCIQPNLIISLQNTAVKFSDIPQIVYLHQSIQYYKDIKWNVFESSERKMWFYKYIYVIWIYLSIKRDHYIVVQTDWMKNELISANYKESNIIVSVPGIKRFYEDEISIIERDKNKIYLFYPAADYKYKNHDIIIDTISELVRDDNSILDRIKVIFTVEEDSRIYKKIEKLKLNKLIECIGRIDYTEVLKFYKSSDIILFPSYIETIGLPLIEAASFGKKIIVSDRKYSREVLSNYTGAEFIKYDDKLAWKESINRNINKYHNNHNIEKINHKDEWYKFISLINNTLFTKEGE